ncbi:MAG: nucleotidyltransferase domain-containing protein [Ignavibacteriaceae bacterium]|nr:nucleotidyltransferase domain-containing protein [Ignavibacteriaceae bacterium]
MNNFNQIDYDIIVRRILSETKPEKIIVFGSRGRGDNAPDADLDLLIIDKRNFEKDGGRFELRKRIRRALSDINVPKDILLYSTVEAEYWKDYPNHILSTCLTQGKEIYAAS